MTVETRPEDRPSDVHLVPRERVRSSRVGLGLGTRARTENVARLPKRELEAGRVHLRVLDEVDAARPRTRGECEGGARPCIFVSCRHNLFLDVDDEIGSIKYNFPDKEPDEVDPERSCALDIADLGGGTLEDIGRLTNVTRERIRQIEVKALTTVQRRARGGKSEAGVLREFCDAPGSTLDGPRQSCGSVFGKVDHFAEADSDSDQSDGRELTGVSFFTDAEDGDQHVSRSIWTMFARWQNGRGFPVSAKAAAAARAAKTQGREVSAPEARSTTMAKTKSGSTAAPGSMLEKALAGFQAFEAKHGRSPSSRELFDALGEASAKSVNNVHMALRRLVSKGLLPGTAATPLPGVKPLKGSAPRPSRGAKPKAKSAEPSRSRNNGTTPRAQYARPTSTDPVVAALVARRDELADKVAALTVAIEAMS